MNPSSRNPFLHPGRRPVEGTTTEPRRQPGSSRPNTGDGPASGGTETPRAAATAEASPDRNSYPEDNIRERIKAAAIVIATILALRLYAAIAPPSPW